MKTPTTLLEAIQNGMMIGPAKLADETIKTHVRDFLAQKFGAAILGAETKQEEELIKKLWLSVTGEELK